MLDLPILNMFFNSQKKDVSPNMFVLNIFGIRLYLDDLIILGILFFLYQEDVQDSMLYVVLIMLLLS